MNIIKYILGTLVILLMFSGCLNNFHSTQRNGNNTTVSIDKGTKEAIIDIANLFVKLNGGEKAELINIENKYGMKAASFKVIGLKGNENFTFYITPDNKALIPYQPIEITELKNKLETSYKAMQEAQRSREEGISIPYTIATGANKKGNGSIIFIEFSDFQCPFCKRFVDLSLQSIEKKYLSNITFYYRYYPLTTIHPMAYKAAMFGECAARQGKFWEMHDKLYAKQNEWISNTSKLYDIAKNIGLNMDSLNECLNDKTVNETIQKDLSDGQKYGVVATPTFFIKVPKSYDKEKVKEAFNVVLNISRDAKFLIEKDYYVLEFSGAYPFQIFDELFSKLLQ